MEQYDCACGGAARLRLWWSSLAALVVEQQGCACGGAARLRLNLRWSSTAALDHVTCDDSFAVLELETEQLGCA